jgi:hypothetical protein
LMTINRELSTRGLRTVSKPDVEQRMRTNNEVFMRALNNIVRRTNGRQLDQIIGKLKLVKELEGPRLATIRKEREEEGWQPTLEIEKTLQRIFRMIPFTL